ACLSIDHSTFRVSISFFFYTRRTIHALPSFPTRRSSDLHRARGRDRRARRAAADRAHRGARRLAADLAGPPQRDDPSRARRGRGDRKSTRLNSSHVSISYAVFCLKKKNTLSCYRE